MGARIHLSVLVVQTSALSENNVLGRRAVMKFLLPSRGTTNSSLCKTCEPTGLMSASNVAFGAIVLCMTLAFFPNSMRKVSLVSFSTFDGRQSLLSTSLYQGDVSCRAIFRSTFRANVLPAALGYPHSWTALSPRAAKML